MLVLNVPFAEKDEAKSLGARWEPMLKAWYVPVGVPEHIFTRWAEPDKQPSQAAAQRGIIAEALGTRNLFVDMIPQSAWFSNLRSEITPDEWQRVKAKTFKAALHRCEVCLGIGQQWPVECHERFNYDDATGIQTLLGTIALCPACHEVTHFGLARIKNRDGIATEHMMKITSCSAQDVANHVNAAMQTWKRRSKLQWILDATWLTGFIETSAATQLKIDGHRRGGERQVQHWQKKIQAGYCPSQ